MVRFLTLWLVCLKVCGVKTFALASNVTHRYTCLPKAVSLVFISTSPLHDKIQIQNTNIKASRGLRRIISYRITYAPSEDSDQSAHPRKLIRVFAGHCG